MCLMSVLTIEQANIDPRMMVIQGFNDTKLRRSESVLHDVQGATFPDIQGHKQSKDMEVLFFNKRWDHSDERQIFHQCCRG